MVIRSFDNGLSFLWKSSWNPSIEIIDNSRFWLFRFFFFSSFWNVERFWVFQSQVILRWAFLQTVGKLSPSRMLAILFHIPPRDCAMILRKLERRRRPGKVGGGGRSHRPPRRHKVTIASKPRLLGNATQGEGWGWAGEGTVFSRRGCSSLTGSLSSALRGKASPRKGHIEEISYAICV